MKKSEKGKNKQPPWPPRPPSPLSPHLLVVLENVSSLLYSIAAVR